MHILGIDVGGTGIKAAFVDTEIGALLSERIRVTTPHPATPAAIGATLKELVEQYQWKGPIGIGFPAAIQHGVARTAANIDPSFIGLPITDYFSQQTACPTYMVNDADAAGLAEIRFGAGKGNTGVVLIITIGTGLGTALFINGQLLPNTELGHLLLENGVEAEHYASETARLTKNLKWKEWGTRLNLYLSTMETLFWPDLIVLGGGVSAKLHKFSGQLTTKAPVVAANFLNQAGIVGAALFAKEELQRVA
ncbi:polyphosphate--glucose phosphotransferase [Propionivibrio sp.]|uniref:polyphosphate--glucose phosphotransferase n=1 Tax=Propionivibrio sp. TaxID=2212460 RepID=UPI00262B9193|nr:ROK family protein [Propionivibrio sp.]